MAGQSGLESCLSLAEKKISADKEISPEYDTEPEELFADILGAEQRISSEYSTSRLNSLKQFLAPETNPAINPEEIESFEDEYLDLIF